MNSSSKNYQDFEPRFEWLHHPDSHVLTVHLLGFRSNQLKVQVTSTGKLRVTGERRLGSGKLLRFHKEIDIPADADTDKISAKLEEGILYVKLPKKPAAAAAAVVSSTAPPVQQPKPTTQSQPPHAATAKPTVDPPTVRQNAPKSQNERPKKPTENPMADPPSIGQNAPHNQNEKAETQASGKQIPSAQKPMEKTEKQTEDEEEKGNAHTTLKEALKKTREEENGEEGSHGREEKEGGVAERRRRRTMRRMSEEMEEESGRWRRGEGYKKVIDGMVKDLRTNMVTLVLGVAVFVIVYFNVTKQGHRVEEEL